MGTQASSDRPRTRYTSSDAVPEPRRFNPVIGLCTFTFEPRLESTYSIVAFRSIDGCQDSKVSLAEGFRECQRSSQNTSSF